MGAIGAAVRTPWDVPVRLVQVPDGPAVESWLVDPGVPLPGIEAVALHVATIPEHTSGPTQSRTPGRGTLVGVTPVLAGGTPAGRLDDLGAVFDDLREDDGAVPVGVDVTPFGRAVLEALAAVPAGTTCTYAGLASLAGRPRAVRAVASVMARNTVPLVLPCHRIVPASGGSGGYGWGTAVKSALLAAEAAR